MEISSRITRRRSSAGWLLSVLLVLALLLPGCRGCSRSGRESLEGQRRNHEAMTEREITTTGLSENIVRMRHAGGIYYVPLKVNGLEMEFIFDTGASIISISLHEARLMRRQGKLDEDDILGASFFSDATGTISEGTRLNLKEVEIGNRTLYNVEASVVHNLKAPLLLGQSALNQFGRITIDYDKKELILE
ncbi:MAG: TIGR02281 family clan AA aspartic protease [Bacteroidales bacterium]